MKIRLANSQDAECWEHYVSQHPKATPYHRFGWGRAVESAYGLPMRYFIAKQSGKVAGVFPCIHFKKPLGKNKYCALPYCDLGYPLADSEEVEQALYHALFAEAKSEGVNQLIERGIAQQEAETPVEQLQGRKVSMRLALPESSELLMASFKSKLRSQIRKAEKNGLHFVTGRTPELLQHFYEVIAVNMRALGSPVHSFAWFQQLVNHYGEHALLSVVYLQEQPIGAGLILRNGDMASIPWASTKGAFNHLAPNMMLYWSLLSYCAEHGIQTFDFGRSTYGAGTYKFKAQWGAQPRLLNWQSYTNGQPDAQTHSQVSASKERLKTLVVNSWRKMPVALTTALGPALRKYIDL